MKIFIALLLLTAFLSSANPAHAERDNVHKCDTIKKDQATAIPSYKKTPHPKFTYENVRDYIFSNLTYPPEAINTDIEGTVIISFVITETGTADSIKIVQPIHPLLDNEALRLIKEMPKWKRVYDLSGQPIRLQYEVPVIFELKK